MDNGLSSLVAGKRRRDGYVNDEDVKENLKASRQWYNGSQQKEPQSNGHYSLQQKQQHLSEATTSTPSLNMEQRVMAAAALQDLRGITESSKVFFQSQLQQQKYQQVMNSDAVTLGESSTALPPLPYIRTPPLHSEADTHNGSPSSSSSGPYTNMPVGQYNGLSQSQHRSNEAPIQQQHESESSYSSLMQTSQSTLLAQNTQQPDRENGMHSSGPLASYQRDDFPHGQVVQSVGLPQNGNVHQHPARTLVQNGVAFHHSLPGNGFQNGTQNGGLQQQQQVLPNQLPQGDSQRLGSNGLHAQGRHGMASSSHHHQQQQMGLPMHQQGGIHRMQENMVQYQTGQMSQSNLAPQQQPGQHCSSNGAPPAAAPAPHPSVQGCSSGFQHPEPGFSPLHGDFHQVPNSWYPSMRDSTTETQPSVSTSRLLLPPSVTDQRGLSLPSLPPQQQLSQVPGGGGFGEVQIPDQDHSSSSAVVANGALDDPALQRALMRPPTRLTRRSYTKVYKLGSITRAVDVNRFKNYTELRCGLAHMFNLEGQLDQKLGWQLIFTDNEDDLLLVGDDPWEEFVRNVRAIRILTPAEVFYYTNEDKWTAATYNSNGGSAPKLL